MHSRILVPFTRQEEGKDTKLDFNLTHRFMAILILAKRSRTLRVNCSGKLCEDFVSLQQWPWLHTLQEKKERSGTSQRQGELGTSIPLAE